MNRLLIKNTLLDDRNVDILIEGNTIAEISDRVDIKVDNVIDAHGMSVLPGFVNAHTHIAMTSMRGVKEDLPLHDWLDAIWKIESQLTDEMLYIGAKLACLEMIKSGTTSFNDHYWALYPIQKAVEEMGLRSVHYFDILNVKDTSRIDEMKVRFDKALEMSKGWPERTKLGVGIHSIYTVCKEMIQWGASYAREHGLSLHMHVSETEKEVNDIMEATGMTPVKYLDSLGVLGPDVTAAHCLWLDDDDDVEILAKRGVKVVYNVNSNLKIGSGLDFRYSSLKGAGATICVGTDGCASSNNLDILETLKTSALVQKGREMDPKILPLDELIILGTVNGAKSLNINAGVVEKGALADLILVNTDSYPFIPDLNFKANLIYSANSSCIDTVICDGKILMQDRIVQGEDEIMKESIEIFKKLYDGRIN